MDCSDAVNGNSLTHHPLHFIALAGPSFENSINARMRHRTMLNIGQQVLLADIGDVTAVGIFGKKMVKGLIARRTHRFRDRLVPFLAIGKNRIYIENHPAKIENAVTHDISNRKLCFGHFGRA